MRITGATLITLSLATAVAADAEPVWLTIVGDPKDPTAETVQVDATSAMAFEKSRIVTLRANRAQRRLAHDEQGFRSYESMVLIDCTAGTAYHRTQILYAEPLWSGAVRTAIYDGKDMPPMAFPEMKVNPKDRIIKAACAIDLVETK